MWLAEVHALERASRPASTLATWRCSRNQSNHSGNSVKTSISISPSPGPARRGRGTRGRSRSAAARGSTARIASVTIGTSSGSPPSAARDLQHLARGQLEQPRRRCRPRCSPSTTAQPSSSCAHHSPSAERRRLALRGDGQLAAAQRLGRRAVLDALEAHDRVRVGAGAAHDLARSRRRPSRSCRACSSRGAGAGHVEAAVEAVGAPDAPRVQRRGARSRRCSARCAAVRAQSTMSTST